MITAASSPFGLSTRAGNVLRKLLGAETPLAKESVKSALSEMAAQRHRTVERTLLLTPDCGPRTAREIMSWAEIEDRAYVGMSARAIDVLERLGMAGQSPRQVRDRLREVALRERRSILQVLLSVHNSGIVASGEVLDWMLPQEDK